MSLPLTGAGPSAAAAAPFVGFLDGVSNVEHVYLLFRGLSAYTGDLVRLRRDSDDAEADFGVDGGGEFLDTIAIQAWLDADEATTAYVVTIYDQTANGDDITQATEAQQPALTLSDATANNRPVFFNGAGTEYLRGAFSTGGALSQPFTIYTAGKLDTGQEDDGKGNYLIDSDDTTNRMLVFKYQVPNPDAWDVYYGIHLAGSAADDNWNIFTALANWASSQFWKNGTSENSGNAGTHTPDGITVGASYNLSGPWTGKMIGVIICEANSSNADKNTIGQKFDTVYGITYTDIT